MIVRCVWLVALVCFVGCATESTEQKPEPLSSVEPVNYKCPFCGHYTTPYPEGAAVSRKQITSVLLRIDGVSGVSASGEHITASFLPDTPRQVVVDRVDQWKAHCGIDLGGYTIDVEPLAEAIEYQQRQIDRASDIVKQLQENNPQPPVAPQ